MAQSKRDAIPAKTAKRTTAITPRENLPPKQPSGQAQMDISGLNLAPKDEPIVEEEPPKAAIALDKLLEQVRAELRAQEQVEKRGLSLVVIGAIVWCFQITTICLRLCRSCRRWEVHSDG